MMLSRALSLATVTLLIGCCVMGQVQAQENLEAGKSPSQIFAGTCTACHKGPRGLLKTVPPGSLPGFLRQHYTTSSEMAGVLASFLISNGATDTRYSGGAQPKGAKEAKSDSKPAGPDQLDRFGRRLHPASAGAQETEPRQAVRTEPEAPAGQGEPTRPGRNAKRLARPAEAPDAAKPAVDGEVPAQAASERGPEGRKLSAKQQRGKPGVEEAPKIEPAKPEPAREEATGSEEPKSDIKSETAKVETGKPEIARPAEAPSQSANAEPAKDVAAPVLRPDPVPPVTPAPPVSPAKAAETPAAGSSGGGAEPSAAAAVLGTPIVSPAPAETASMPLPPVTPAGPPAPPISQ